MRVIVSVLAATLAVAPRPADACEALQTDTPTGEQLEECLSSRPFVVASGGLSLAIGGDTGTRGGLFATMDVPVLRPVWLSARTKVGSSYSDFDLLAGWVLRSSYGAGVQTFTMAGNTYRYPGAYSDVTVTEYKAHSANVVQRGALMVLGGIKGVRRTITGDMEPSLDMKTLELGIAHHHANNVGSHSRMEAFVVTRGGKFGGVLTWHNSVPSAGRIVVGMEVGYVPVAAADDETTHTFYWNIIDIGASFEL